jgi:hypothetical protein
MYRGSHVHINRRTVLVCLLYSENGRKRVAVRLCSMLYGQRVFTAHAELGALWPYGKADIGFWRVEGVS